MATQSESLKDDRISELPEEIQHQILERLPTYEVARTAVLSKQWNGVWLRHHRLVFDHNVYLKCIPSSEGNKRLTFAKIIHGVLSRRTGSIKSFTLKIAHNEYIPQQYDLDQWCLILSRSGVEELNILFSDLDSWRGLPTLPVCIVSCLKIKQLKLTGLAFDFPLNLSCIFPNVTSLLLGSVSFEKLEVVSNIPNLETIGFMLCYRFDKLKVSIPKLESLMVLSVHDMFMNEGEWVKLHWNTIKTLCVPPDWLLDLFIGEPCSKYVMFPTPMNLQTIRLYEFNIHNAEHFALALQLLRRSPNLCQLEISASSSMWKRKEASSRLLDDLNSCSIYHNLEMLRTVKIESFGGKKLEMLFVKMLLSKLLVLDKLIISRGEDINASKTSKIAGELLRLPRASQKAQVDFIMRYPYDLVSVPNFWN